MNPRILRNHRRIAWREEDEKHGGNAEERKIRIWSGKGNRESDYRDSTDDDEESVGICRCKRPGSASEI